MVFSSLVFLFAFLPIVLALYLICPRRCRNLLLVIVSLFFYAWGEPKYVLILLFSTVFDYANGRAISYFAAREKSRAKLGFLILSVIGNLALLCFFKYTDFFIQSWNTLVGASVNLLQIALPIGISFYTFQTMSYTIDVYRGKVTAQKNIINFAMYVCMFPQLIAGPVVRYRQVENQLTERTVTGKLFAAGMQRFLVGLGKKVIIANNLGMLWEDISVTRLSGLSTAEAWLGAAAFTLQIYFDFSGYSDMAIGLGQMFGFHFPENFRHPYVAKSITEFWRRWHISLTTWFKEYVYIPLGGSKKGISRQIVNLFVVWLLTGFWHGASWNFVLWGLYFFVILVIEKVFLLKAMAAWPKFFRHLYALALIAIGWVIFAMEDFSQMGLFFKVMFGAKNQVFSAAVCYDLKNYGVILLIAVIAATRLPMRFMRGIRRYMLRAEREFFLAKGKNVRFVFTGIATVCILLISISFLVGDSYNPFLYFRF